MTGGIDDGLRLVHASVARARGVPALLQGSYGDAGNLELVFADAEAGLWVHWRNNDAADVRPGAVAGGWSAGLRVAPGRRYDAVAELETRHGPRNLEVVAGAGGRVDRLLWSPDAGFASPTPLRPGGPGAIALLQLPHEQEHALVLVTTAPAGGVETSRASTAAYPVLHFDPPVGLADGLGPVSGVSAVLVGNAPMIAALAPDGSVQLVDAAGEALLDAPVRGCRANPVLLPPAVDGSGPLLVVADAEAGLRVLQVVGREVVEQLRVGADLGAVDAVAACRTTLGPGTIEVVLRLGERLQGCTLRPVGSALTVSASPAPVVTSAWVAPAVATVNV